MQNIVELNHIVDSDWDLPSILPSTNINSADNHSLPLQSPSATVSSVGLNSSTTCDTESHARESTADDCEDTDISPEHNEIPTTIDRSSDHESALVLQPVTATVCQSILSIV